eukprot:c23629_g1_i1 orf=294-1445(+)
MAVAYSRPSLPLVKSLFCVSRAPALASVLVNSPLSLKILSAHSQYPAGRLWQYLLRNYSAGKGVRDGGDNFDPFGKANLGSSLNGEEGKDQLRTYSGNEGQDKPGKSYTEFGRNDDDEDEDDILFGKGGILDHSIQDAGLGKQEWEGENLDWRKHPDFSGDGAAETTSGDREGEGEDYVDGEGTYGLYGIGGKDTTEGWEGTAHPHGKGEESFTATGDSGDGDGEENGQRQPASFGDLIKKTGYTEDQINQLILGISEPATLPHLDDYKFVDKEAQIKKKRRELELAKMAEMAKRWVRKVNEHGFSHGVGRRKASVARVWIREGEGKIVINKKYHDMYFVNIDNRAEYLGPFVVTETMGMFDTFVIVRGGGTSGQAGAIRHGL